MENSRKKVVFPSEKDESSSSFPSSPARAVGGRRLKKGSKASYSAQSQVGLTAEKEDGYDNPRSFPHHVKKQCWDKADKIKGRDPERWRRDTLGNTVFRKLVGCPGCLCHDYDHVVPFSKVFFLILQDPVSFFVI